MNFYKSLLLLGIMPLSSNAFVVHNRQIASTCSKNFNISIRNNSVIGVPHMTATNVSEDQDQSTSEKCSELSPDFQVAMEKVVDTLQSSVKKPDIVDPLIHFVREYFHACNESNKSGNNQVTAASTTKAMMDAVQYGMKYGMGNKYTFGVTHKALRGIEPEKEDGNTIDFYKFGCDFFRPAIDVKNSLALGEDALKKVKEQIDNGENVIFFANHQSEADPQVMSVMLEKAGYEAEAESLVYVAGHKVTTDTLAIPFSMGRNLICIHSKKHIDADPETKSAKSKQNLQAMSGMLEMLRNGGTFIWVAPSGGRDRRLLDGSGRVPIAPFDQKTIDMFRLMGNKSKKPTHFYAVSMVSYDLCPPPDFVEAGTGEQRNVRFVPVGIKVSDELENVGGVESRHLFTQNAMEICEKDYEELLSALDKKGE